MDHSGVLVGLRALEKFQSPKNHFRTGDSTYGPASFLFFGMGADLIARVCITAAPNPPASAHPRPPGTRSPFSHPPASAYWSAQTSEIGDAIFTVVFSGNRSPKETRFIFTYKSGQSTHFLKNWAERQHD